MPENLPSDVIRWGLYHFYGYSSGGSLWHETFVILLTVVDQFSKAAHFIPLPKLPSARETALTVIDHVFRMHGLPMAVVSDRGSQFVSKFWKEFCHLLGVKISISSSFHPQRNSQTERANQDLEWVLQCLVSQNPFSWSQQLSWVEYVHNSLPVSSTSLSKVV